MSLWLFALSAISYICIPFVVLPFWLLHCLLSYLIPQYFQCTGLWNTSFSVFETFFPILPISMLFVFKIFLPTISDEIFFQVASHHQTKNLEHYSSLPSGRLFIWLLNFLYGIGGVLLFGLCSTLLAGHIAAICVFILALTPFAWISAEISSTTIAQALIQGIAIYSSFGSFRYVVLLFLCIYFLGLSFCTAAVGQIMMSISNTHQLLDPFTSRASNIELTRMKERRVTLAFLGFGIIFTLLVRIPLLGPFVWILGIGAAPTVLTSIHAGIPIFSPRLHSKE